MILKKTKQEKICKKWKFWKKIKTNKNNKKHVGKAKGRLLANSILKK
jgi:hypothetical protein